MFRTFTLGAIAASALATHAAAEITISDAYIRSIAPGAPTGAAFMQIENSADTADRLIEARASIAARVELHTHEADDAGVMRMFEVEDGFPIPAGGMHVLQRGGDHVMFMGVTEPLEQGAMVDLTLVFENAGAVAVSIPVDRERMGGHGGMAHGHSRADD